MRNLLHKLLLLTALMGMTCAWLDTKGYGQQITSGALAHWGFATNGLPGVVQVRIHSMTL